MAKENLQEGTHRCLGQEAVGMDGTVHKSCTGTPGGLGDTGSALPVSVTLLVRYPFSRVVVVCKSYREIAQLCYLVELASLGAQPE